MTTNVTRTVQEYDEDLKFAMRSSLRMLIERHTKYRAKISSQCDTLISKKLVEDMIKELE